VRIPLTDHIRSIFKERAATSRKEIQKIEYWLELGRKQLRILKTSDMESFQYVDVKKKVKEDFRFLF